MIKSPYTDFSFIDGACHVTSSGVVVGVGSDDVGFSYGRRSPVTVSSDSACNVLPSGHVDYDYHNVVPYNSYGSPDTSFGGTNRSMHSFVVWMDENVGYISRTIFDGSYGGI